MAMATCIKCGHSVFEISEKTPSGSNFKLNFVQCAKCGGVVGVLDFYNLGELILRLAEKLGFDLSR